MKVIARTIGWQAHPDLPASGTGLPGEVQKKYPTLP
jgi:hypothetical protein